MEIEYKRAFAFLLIGFILTGISLLMGFIVVGLNSNPDIFIWIGVGIWLAFNLLSFVSILFRLITQTKKELQTIKARRR